MPVIVDIPYFDLSMEELLDQLEICVASDKGKLRKNMEYFNKNKNVMTPDRRRVNAQRIENELIRLNLMDELLTRLKVFDMIAIRQSIDLAVKTELYLGHTLPDIYQYVITVNEINRTLSTQYNRL